MSYFFKASEIVQFAIKLEENRERFYRYAMQMMQDDNVKKILKHLADEEVIHKNIFQKLLSQVGNYKPIESYPGEYLAYLQAYVNAIIFTNAALNDEFPSVSDSLSALDFGLQRELESILYYQEMKNFVPEAQRHILDTIITEEREHFTKLSDLKTHIETLTE